jgi:hypothetical protein
VSVGTAGGPVAAGTTGASVVVGTGAGRGLETAGVPAASRTGVLATTGGAVVDPATAARLEALAVGGSGASDSGSDIGLITFTSVDWSNRHVALEQLYQLILQNGRESIDWYLAHKSAKRLGAMVLRLGAIGLATLAAITPVLVALLPAAWGLRELGPLASIMVALSAGCLALDKFFGFSSGWMRYITTELELRARLNGFQLTWMQERLKLSEQALTFERTLELLQFMKAFVSDFDQVVNAETKLWVEEFRGNLSDMERAVETQRATTPVITAPASTGALRIRLEGAELLDGQRWLVQLGNEPFAEHVGGTMVVNNLSPGLLAVKVKAHRDGRPLAAEDVAFIRAGEPSDLVIRLLQPERPVSNLPVGRGGA